MIETPGLYPDIPEHTYHADSDLHPTLGRSLSASGAKTLLVSPARFAYERDHPRQPTDARDIGTLAHTELLGTGQQPWIIDADDWRSAKVRAERDAARSYGLLPVLEKDWAAVQAMVNAVRSHPLAGRIFAAEAVAESSAYWIDDATGVTLRARIDWLTEHAIVDLKTTVDGSPVGFSRQCDRYSYHLSAAHYVNAVQATTGKTLPFLLVAVEKDAPHFVSVHQFDGDYLDIGDAEMRRAIDLYAECESSGVWPAYGDDIHTISPPRWLRRTLEF